MWRRVGKQVGAVALGATVSIGLGSIGADAAGASSDVAGVEAEMLAGVNDERAARGIPHLSLAAGAPSHARDVAETMRDSQRLEHTPVDILAGWYMPPNSAAAETIARNGGGSAAAVVRNWMASDHHRDLLLDARFDHVAVGAAFGGDGVLWAAIHLLDGPSEPAPAPEPASEPAPAPAPAPGATGSSASAGSDGPSSTTTTSPPPVAAEPVAAPAEGQPDEPITLALPDDAGVAPVAAGLAALGAVIERSPTSVALQPLVSIRPVPVSPVPVPVRPWMVLLVGSATGAAAAVRLSSPACPPCPAGGRSRSG